jgi:hypothetical protein
MTETGEPDVTTPALRRQRDRRAIMRPDAKPSGSTDQASGGQTVAPVRSKSIGMTALMRVHDLTPSAQLAELAARDRRARQSSDPWPPSVAGSSRFRPSAAD